MNIHPISENIFKMYEYFSSMGFEVHFLPEIESVENNFDKSNVPKLHAIRTLQNSYFLKNDNFVLRSHTTSYQHQCIESGFPHPISKLFIGKVYRRTKKRSKVKMFHQVEGIMIAPQINLSHLKFILDEFLSSFLGEKRKNVYLHKGDEFKYCRFSVDYSFNCFVCFGKGCKLCGHKGSRRFMGCGLIHPNILKEYKAIGYSGITFAIGLEQLLCLIYDIDDIRKLYS